MNRITVDQLTALEAPTLIDVREPNEYAAGHAPSAVNLPLSEITNRVDDVPPEGPVHIICQSGGRSAQATAFLTDRAINAINVEGGTNACFQGGHALEAEQS